MEYCKGRTGKITLSWSTPSGPVLSSHRNHPHVVMMPMFVKWEDEQSRPNQDVKDESAYDAAGGAEVEETEAVAEVEDAGQAETVNWEVETTEAEKSETTATESRDSSGPRSLQVTHSQRGLTLVGPPWPQSTYKRRNRKWRTSKKP